MSRSYNFCAGPAALPSQVLKKAASEMSDWEGLGLSVMEMSHRSPEFVSIAKQAEQNLRDLIDIPDNYKVLFLQGGATAQFSMVPMNLLGENKSADYIVTGQWSSKAVKEASKFCNVNIAGSSEDTLYDRVPLQTDLALNPEAAYVHYTPNETIGGVEFNYIPDTGTVPLVADFSSSILSECIDVSRFGLIYAGAQKNIGPAGLCIVVVREDLLDRVSGDIPSVMNYKIAADNGSMYNTPPTYTWYLTGLVFEWLKEQGGVASIEKVNQKKAKTLYDYIDGSNFYSNPIVPDFRSHMNVPFILADEALNKLFLQEAEENNLLNLKGHRSVGGMRASIYNAVPQEAVVALVEFMDDFAQRHGS